MTLRNLLWEALIDEAECYSAYLSKRLQGFLNSAECDDACELAMSDALDPCLRNHGAEIFDPQSLTPAAEQLSEYLAQPNNAIRKKYRRIAYRRAVEMLRKKGHRKCPHCRPTDTEEPVCCPTGSEEPVRCSRCVGGWLRGEGLISAESWGEIPASTHQTEPGFGAEIDSHRPFVFPPGFLDRLHPRTRRVFVAIQRELNPREQRVWWVWAMDNRRGIPNAQLAAEFGVQEATIRQLLHRARQKVQRIVERDR